MVSVLVSLNLKAQVFVGGELTGNELYTPVNNPYIVTEDLIVGNDITLTVSPGVIMLFRGGTALRVNNGTLIASGTETQKIRFEPEINSGLSGQWNGLIFNNAKTILSADSSYMFGSVLSNIIINYAADAITLAFGTEMLIEKAEINHSDCALSIFGSGKNVIRSCAVIDCEKGIFFANGYKNANNRIYNNKFLRCASGALLIDNQGLFSHHNIISRNRIESCGTGIQVGSAQAGGAGYNLIDKNVFISNTDALTLYHDLNTVTGNRFVSNINGLICTNSDQNSISYNLFSRHRMNCITLMQGSSFNSITFNSLNYSSGGAWVVENATTPTLSNSLSYNTAYGNSDFSFFFQQAPQASVQFNNLIGNGDLMSFQNQSDTLIHAEYNFWGSQSSSHIDSLIYDHSDNTAFGEVLYNPFLDNILTTAPVPPPASVVKQVVGNSLIVTWDAVDAADLTGYNIYFGTNDGITFENHLSNGMLRSINLGLFNPEDTVAITAFDFQADGFWDQTEGHESDFTFASIAPYAGPDTAVCFDEIYSIAYSTAYDYESLVWTSSGDGVFNNAHLLHPVYTPGPQDYLNGSVTLFLKATKGEKFMTDEAVVTFHEAAKVYAGNDTIISSDLDFDIIYAVASGYTGLKWTSSGDGTFTDDTRLNTIYSPGVTDSVAGKVILTLTAYSVCGFSSDQFVITLEQGYTIKGKVWAGDTEATGSRLSVFREAQGRILPVRSDIQYTSGEFEINSLLEGIYLIYSVPDKTLFPGFLPSYFYSTELWSKAQRIVLNGNTYDVDIDLLEAATILPSGSGSISGYCSTTDSTQICTDLTILLCSPDLTRVFDFEYVRKGNNFSFSDLPFGRYVLVAEKAGFSRYQSGVITLSPDVPLVQEVEMLCSTEGFKFIVKQPAAETTSASFILYPNPATNVINLFNFPADGPVSVSVFNLSGKLVSKDSYTITEGQTRINISTLPKGMYILEIRGTDDLSVRSRFIKD